MKNFKVDFSLDELEMLSAILTSFGKLTSCKEIMDAGIDVNVFASLCRKIDDSYFYMTYDVERRFHEMCTPLYSDSQADD